MNFYPNIRTEFLKEAREQVLLAASYPGVETVQIDVADGQLIEEVTLTPADLPGLDFGEFNLDLHILTEEPLDYVYEALDHADHLPLRAIIGQVERMSRQDIFLDFIKNNQLIPGLSLDLYTPLEEISKASWKDLKVVQLMAVEIGSEKEGFKQLVIEKIKELRKISQNNDCEIEIIVKGGVIPKDLSKIIKAGADGVVIDSSLWTAADLKDL